MKYDCEVIQDLLPLYEDEILSGKSIEIINEHLLECVNCRKVYQSIKKDKSVEYTEKTTAETNVYKRFSKKVKAIRISLTALMLVVILSVPLLCFSANNFNTVNFVSSGIGVISVVCTNTEYVEIQSSPRVILAKPDNAEETFISIIESEGYTFISDDSNNQNMSYSIENTFMPDKPAKDTEGTFIIEKNGKREYISWTSNSYYSKFVW